MKPLEITTSAARPPAPVDRAQEARWVDRARRGDRDAFDCLAVAALPTLLGSARRLLVDDHAAEEAVAEALFRAFRRLEAFEGRSRFSTWVHRILFRVVADRVKYRVRERARRLQLLERAAPPASVTPAERLSAHEQHQRLREATQQLPPTQRLVLLLVAWEGLSLTDAAEVLDMRYRTVKSNLHHARRALERILAEEDPS